MEMYLASGEPRSVVQEGQNNSSKRVLYIIVDPIRQSTYE